MRIQFVLSATLIFLLSACKENQPHHHYANEEDSKAILVSQIDSLESVFKEEGLQDKFTVSKLIASYSEFRNQYKEDERAADYFLKAGNLAKSLNDWGRAADVYKNFFNDFQNHPKREEVLYLLGGIYDLWLTQKDDAKQTYEHYLKIYPSGEYVDEVTSSLELINVPIEERVKIFQERRKKAE